MANYLYNGVELPDVNTVWTDKETYPYALISQSGYLTLAKSIQFGYPLLGGDEWCTVCDDAYQYITSDDGERWEAHNEKVDYACDIRQSVWANFDVLNEDGSVYLAASAPVPVTIESFPADAYVVQGGKLYKMNRCSGGGSSVQPDYNQNDSEQPDYIKNRPFYEETVTGEVVVEYDGDSTGKVVVPIGDTQLVKVSDLTPEPSELIGGTATMGEDSMTITADVIEDARPAMPGVAVGDGMLMICYEPIPAYGITEAGMYLVDMGVAASLTYTGTVTNIKKLDPKFLEFSKVSDTPIVDETVTNDYSFTNSFAVVVGDTYLVEYDGTRYFCVAKTLTVGDVFVTYLGNADAVGLEDTGEPFIIYNTEEKWILGTKSSTPDHSIKIYHVECAKIPKECLPEDIGGDCGLPEVTEADNGKFLQVVDGAYALVALTDVSLEGA